MKQLTQRQQEILAYLRGHFTEEGYWPSIRDIQTRFSFKSTNAVMGHLRALERKRVIQRVAGQARAYRLPETPFVSSGPASPAEAMELVEIPIYGSIAAGYPDGVETGGEIGRLRVDPGTAGRRRGVPAFALKVRGDSMIKAGIFDGDIVILEPGHPRHHDIVAALIDGETTLKRYIEEAGQSPYLKAENDLYPRLYPLNELCIQGVAKAVVRSL